MRLVNQVAIVTGGAGGMGKGICDCLAREGCNIIVADLDIEGAKTTVASIEKNGNQGLAVTCDVTDEQACISAVNHGIQTFGKIDILVNNAGHFGETVSFPFTKLSAKEWDENFSVNVKGPFFMSKAVAQIMMERRFGKIINISSIAAKRDPTFLQPYSAAKNALLNLTRIVAKDLGPYNVNVNAVLPGLVWTPFWHRLAPMLAVQDPKHIGKDPRQLFDEVAGNSVLGRSQTPEDIGNLVAFLASEEARNITGQSINVDGGITMT